MIFSQAIQSFGQGFSNLRNVQRFFLRQVVQILVHGIARVDLVLDTIQAGHHQCSERQVRVGRRVRETHFDTTCFRAVHVWNTDGGRTVTGGVGQHNRCFVARNQTLVAIGCRVGKGVDGLGVLDDTTDIVKRCFAQAGIAVTCEQVLAVFAQGHVYVHAGAVITNHRLGHEGGGFTVGVGHVVYAVLENLHFVSLAGQGVGANADFTLASGADFVVMNLNFQAHGFHSGTHGATQVVQAIHWRNREVTTFNTRAVTDVVAIEVFAGYPGGFFRVDVVGSALHIHIPFNRIENKELRFRTKQGTVSDARGLEVLFRTAGNGAWVTLIALHGGRLYDVTGNVQCGFFGERVQHGGAVVRHQNHVGFIDAFPAGD